MWPFSPACLIKLKGMLLDVKKARAWGCYLIDEMHGWVRGFLEGDKDEFLPILIIYYVAWSLCDLGSLCTLLQVWLGWILPYNSGLAFLNDFTGSLSLEGCPLKRFILSICSLRDSFEDELRAFQGGKDGLVPTIWEDEISNFAQVIIIFYIYFFKQDANFWNV